MKIHILTEPGLLFVSYFSIHAYSHIKKQIHPKNKSSRLKTVLKLGKYNVFEQQHDILHSRVIYWTKTEPKM